MCRPQQWRFWTTEGSRRRVALRQHGRRRGAVPPPLSTEHLSQRRTNPVSDSASTATSRGISSSPARVASSSHVSSAHATWVNVRASSATPRPILGEVVRNSFAGSTWATFGDAEHPCLRPTPARMGFVLQCMAELHAGASRFAQERQRVRDTTPSHRSTHRGVPK